MKLLRPFFFLAAALLSLAAAAGPLIEVLDPDGNPVTSGQGGVFFGSVKVGSMKDVAVVVRNTGDSTLNITEEDVGQGDPAFTFTGDTFQTTIAPGASSPLHLQF